MQSMELIDAVSIPAQQAAIQDTFSSTVQAAFQSLPHNDVIPPASAFSSTPSPRVSSVASPNGLNRPLDKALEDKILRSEYVDFSLLLPETLYQTQTPALQLRYEDSPPGSLGCPLTVVKRKKPIVDSSKVVGRVYGVHAGHRHGLPQPGGGAHKVSGDH